MARQPETGAQQAQVEIRRLKYQLTEIQDWWEVAQKRIKTLEAELVETKEQLAQMITPEYYKRQMKTANRDLQRLDKQVRIQMQGLREVKAREVKLRKLLKEVVLQFEGLIQVASEEEYLDDDVEALFVALLKQSRTALGENDG